MESPREDWAHFLDAVLTPADEWAQIVPTTYVRFTGPFLGGFVSGP